MIGRYSTKLAEIWSEKTKLERWLNIEATVAEVEGKLGIIPKRIAKGIRKLKIDPKRIDRIEKETGHDIIAFLLAVKEKIGKKADYLHFGLTSYDLVDTALSLALKESGIEIRKSLKVLIKAINSKARKYKDLPIMGRTHGMYAEPTLLGLKFLYWAAEMERNLRRLEDAIEEVSYGKISGSVGTYSQLPPKVEKQVMKKLGLKPESISTQIIPRDRHAYFIAALSLTAAGLERIAFEIRLLARSEIGEFQESFGRKQRGSSSMPHKKNPILCERICGLARVIRGNLIAAIENIALWHERDISHSSVERIIFPDCTILCHYLIEIMTRVVKGLVINKGRIKENLEAAHSIHFSQRIMLKLTEKGKDKDWAYKKIQELAFQAIEKKKDLKKIVENDKELGKILTKKEINKLFSITELLKNSKSIYNRLLSSSTQ